jgi:secreted PhoX family phosphatase
MASQGIFSMLSRRSFSLGLGSAAFAGLALSGCATAPRSAWQRVVGGYGPLVPDPAKLLDLPQGFSYRIISRLGERMDDGHAVPDRADGMGAFRLDGRRMALVRNHELQAKHRDTGPFRGGTGQGLAAFDKAADGQPLPGGTTTIVLDYRTGQIEAQYLSLVGTIRNCAGGPTPWGSWLTCEEDVSRAGSGQGQDHGWVFEVPAARRGLADPVPLKAMGRFNHEAAAVDPRTGIVYQTEDREDGLFYRFIPKAPGQLARGGRLQALAFADQGLPADSRNWGGITYPLGTSRKVRWVDMDRVESPADDLRVRGHAVGGVLFARGEGIHFGDGELFFCCTSGGAAKLSQIFRYRPSRLEGRAGETGAPGTLELFVESTHPSMLNFGDNLVVAPNGHLVICEDQYGLSPDNHLRGVTPQGALYDLGRLRENTELAGACFSPDGATMFVNVYQPTKTLAITGPWRAFRA